MDTTFRLVALDSRTYGQTAATADLAKLVPGDLEREGQLLGIEQTDWADHFDKKRIIRTILVEAETYPGEWAIGPKSRAL